MIEYLAVSRAARGSRILVTQPLYQGQPSINDAMDLGAQTDVAIAKVFGDVTIDNEPRHIS